MKRIVYIILITFNMVFLILLSLEDLNLRNRICESQKKLSILTNTDQNYRKRESSSYTKDIEDFTKDDKLYIKNLETIPDKRLVSIEIGTKGNLEDIDKLLIKIESKSSFENFAKINIIQEDKNVLDADINVEFTESRQHE